ncbi:MAG: hypothetical protein U0L51_09090 [Olegusella sp.]|nr:hypothetical protein [Olegusella sp.]
MLLTLFLAIMLCAAITWMLVSAVAFVQKEEFFSSAPKAARDVILPREQEPFRDARVLGWLLMGFSLLAIAGVIVIAAWDGVRCGYGFSRFFARFLTILTIYKLYDMTFFDYYLLMRAGFFQFYYPEVGAVYPLKKYGYNLRSQLLKLLVVFPAASALAAWACTLLA